MPGLPEWGGKAIAWFCPSHERTWQRAVGSNAVLVRFAVGLPPMVYWGIVPP